MVGPVSLLPGQGSKVVEFSVAPSLWRMGSRVGVCRVREQRMTVLEQH